MVLTQAGSPLRNCPAGTNLRARTDLGEGTVAELLVKLVILELVESRRTPADESFDPPLYSLTDAGRAVLDEVFARSRRPRA